MATIPWICRSARFLRSATRDLATYFQNRPASNVMETKGWGRD